MSAIGVALRLFAIADASIEETIGVRLRPIHDAQGDILPRATYQHISSLPDECLHGDGGHTHDRIQYNVFDTDNENAHRIAKRLRAVLLDAFGTLPIDTQPTPATLYVTGVATAGGVRDAASVAPTDASDDWLHGATFDLMVSYNPSV